MAQSATHTPRQGDQDVQKGMQVHAKAELFRTPKYIHLDGRTIYIVKVSQWF
jgi:hypothetical protein